MEIYITFDLYTLNFFRLYCEHSSEVAFGCLRQIISFFEDMRKITNQKLVIKLRCFRVMVNQCILISEFPNNKQQHKRSRFCWSSLCRPLYCFLFLSADYFTRSWSIQIFTCSNIRGNFFDRLTNLIPRHYVRHRLFGIRVNLHRFGIKFGVKCILQKDIICYIEVALLAAFHPWDQITRMTSWVLFVRMIWLTVPIFGKIQK